MRKGGSSLTIPIVCMYWKALGDAILDAIFDVIFDATLDVVLDAILDAILDVTFDVAEFILISTKIKYV